jgi:WD40 repeat protein
VPASPDPALDATLTCPERPSVPAVPNLPSVEGYEILGELGRGGMGVVYKARQLQLKRLVALKMILAGSCTGAEGVARFTIEAEAVAQLQHPNIVQIHEIGAHKGLPFFSLEYVGGGTLDARLNGAPLPGRLAAEVAECLARTVHFAHSRGIIHRDLKPANILIADEATPAGPTPAGAAPAPCLVPAALKIADFGLAKRVEGHSGQTQSGVAMGTPSYMAPEQAEGHSRAVGPQADVYALGAILYELLTGRPPFRGATPMDTMMQVISDEPVPPSRLQPHLPRDLTTICLKALHKDRRKRYASALALADDLRRFLDGVPIQARPSTPWERGLKWARRRPALAALAGVSVLAAVALLAGGIWYNAQLAAALDEARAGRDEALRERRQAVRRLVRLNITDGMRQVEDGDPLGSVSCFVEALALDQGDRRREAQHRLRLAAVLGQCPRFVHVWFHGSQVNHAEFSRDGRRVVTASAGGKARLFDVGLPRDTLALTLAHEGAVNWASFSRDGARVVTAGADRMVRIWNAVTGQPIGPALRHPAAVNLAVFSPSGEQVLTAADDGAARIWSLAGGRPLVLRHARRVAHASFGPDGRRVLTVSDDATARVWDAATGMPVTAPLAHAGAVRHGCFSPDGRRVATGSQDGTARVWDAATGAAGPSFRLGNAVHCVAFSPDGQCLLTASAGRAACIWDTVSGKLAVPPLRHQSQVLQAAFSPDGNRVATASDDNTVRVWDAASGEPLGPSLRHYATVFSTSFSPDGRCLLTASQDETVRLWLVPAHQPLSPQAQPQLTPFRAAVSPDGTQRLTARTDKEVIVTRKGRPVGRPLRHGATIYHACFSPDGKRVLTASGDRTARVWEAATGEPVTPPLRHCSAVYHGAFSPDGRDVVTGSDDNTARVWQVATGQPVTPQLSHRGTVYRVAFNPDGDAVLTVSTDGTARVWDAGTGEPLTPPLPPGGWVQKVLASLRDARLWNLPREERPVRDLRLLAQVLSGLWIDRTGGLVPMEPDRLRRAWRDLRSRYPQVFARCPQ